MGRSFRNDLQDEFGGWLIGYTATGGPDMGVLEAVGELSHPAAEAI